MDVIAGDPSGDTEQLAWDSGAERGIQFCFDCLHGAFGADEIKLLAVAPPARPFAAIDRHSRTALERGLCLAPARATCRLRYPKSGPPGWSRRSSAWENFPWMSEMGYRAWRGRNRGLSPCRPA